MKNIHVLPTDKPSRLIYNDANQLCYQSNKSFKNDRKNRKKFNIYITSDEKIKEGDWMIRGIEQPTLVTPNFFWDFGVRYYKIILTTDQELIKDGVQAIDDKFLKWFVKNPSCEFVVVKQKQHFEADKSKRINPLNGVYYSYKIIIPQEEPKQETLEEAAKRFYTTEDTRRDCNFIEGAKWQAERMGLMEIELRHTKTLLASCEKALEDRDKQAERMYTEEEVRKMLFDLGDVLFNNCQNGIKEGEPEKYFDVIIQQFKKK